MNIRNMLKIIDSEFYSGVPDSQIKALCDYLLDLYGTDPKHHIIAANEGNSVAIAAGYYLATGMVPVVYMQNSGEGNIINPVASLLNDKIYAIPMIFVIGWRGEPGIYDEPQHEYQGEITLKLLEDMDIKYFVVSCETSDEDIKSAMCVFDKELSAGKQVAFVVRRGALTYNKKVEYKNTFSMSREEIVKHIVAVSGDDLVISTTGKVSRELFEIRENNKEGHHRDFLTVGSMGHSSSIALGVAINKPNSKVWCIDGDGALLMHMGAVAVIGSITPHNFVHVVINNCAHETVGGMPTATSHINITEIAKASGYQFVTSVETFDELDKVMKKAKEMNELTLIEVKASLGSRTDLGRPTVKAIENKKMFMEFVSMKA